MAKVHKVTLYIVDANSDYDTYNEEEIGEEVKYNLDLKLDTMSHVASVESSKKFEWDDDLRINYTDATTQDYEDQLKKEG